MYELIHFLGIALRIYSYAIIVYIFMSWFPGARESSFGIWLGKITEPYLEQFRRFIPPLGMMDFSPIVALFVLYLAQIGLVELYRMFLGF